MRGVVIVDIFVIVLVHCNYATFFFIAWMLKHALERWDIDKVQSYCIFRVFNKILHLDIDMWLTVLYLSHERCHKCNFQKAFLRRDDHSFVVLHLHKSYHKTFNISHTQSQNLYVSRLVLHCLCQIHCRQMLSWEWRCCPSSEQQLNCLLRCELYQSFHSTYFYSLHCSHYIWFYKSLSYLLLASDSCPTTAYFYLYLLTYSHLDHLA